MLAHSMMKYIYLQQQISMMHSKNIQLYTHGVLSWQNRKSMRVRGSINPRIGLYFLSPGFLKKIQVTGGTVLFVRKVGYYLQVADIQQKKFPVLV